MKSFNSGWYLIYTKPRHEKKVSCRLADLNINYFLPTKKSLRVWHDRKKYLDEPLFPSYVFIYLNSMQHYYQGLETEGALYYVKTGKDAAKVCETVINNIKLIVNKIKDMEMSEDYFAPGKQVVINKGALTGLTCEVVQYNSKQKILVRLDLLQRHVLITLPEESLMVM